MNANASVTDHSPAATSERYTIGFVTSRDGTRLGYRQLGHGPGVVLVHGAMESAQSHMQLAEALADAFTVYLPDRRGRGLSGPYGADYSMQKEVDDVAALLAEVDAHRVFGVSSGGLICLQAALALPTIHKAALYEPALIVNGSASTAWVARYDREIAQGKLAAALVTGMKGAQMGPPFLNAMPNWLLESLTNMMMKGEDKKAKDGDVTMRMLAPTLHYDFQLVIEMSDTQERYRAMGAETLLLSGSKSPAYLRGAVDALAQVLLHAKRIEFPGLDHGASGPTDRGGQPVRVAQELRRFFA
jgi:pimeloyl-ACP methyl ester carboxylesterase